MIDQATTSGPGRPMARTDSEYFEWCDKQAATGVSLDQITPTKCRNALGGSYGRAVELVNDWRDKRKKQDVNKVSAAPAHLQELTGKLYAELIGEIWPKAQRLAAEQWNDERAEMALKQEQLQAENTDQIEYIKQLESRLENQAEKLIETETERDKLQQRFESVTASAGKLSDQLDKTRSDLEQSHQRERERESIINNLRDKLEKMENQRNQVNQQLINSNKDLETANAELTRVNSALADSKAKQDQAAKQSADLGKDVVRLETELANKIERLEQVLKENTDYRENGYKAVRDVITDESEKRRVLKNELDTVKKQLSEVVSKNKQLLAELEQFKGNAETA